MITSTHAFPSLPEGVVTQSENQTESDWDRIRVETGEPVTECLVQRPSAAVVWELCNSDGQHWH